MSEGYHADTGAKLRRMADQIAINFAAAGHEAAVEATALHIGRFWDPRMKAGIFADDLTQLTPIAREAIQRLAAHKPTPAEVRGDEFNKVDEVGHSDAG